MSTGLLNVAALSSDDGLQAAAESAAGAHYILRIHRRPLPLDGSAQRGQIVMGVFLDLCFEDAPDRVVQRIEVRRKRRPHLRSPVGSSVVAQKLLGRFCCVRRRRVLLENVIPIRIRSPKPGDNVWAQQALVDVSIVLFAGGDEDDRAFLPIAANNTQDHLLRRRL